MMAVQFTVGVVSPGLVVLGSIRPRMSSHEEQDAKYHSATASAYQLLFPRFYLQVPALSRCLTSLSNEL